MRSPVFVDGRNMLDPETMRAAGYRYEGIGRCMSLPAVVLVGGEGHTLRPLTERTRKDMLPLVDRPLLAFTFEHLRRHGVERTIVSCGYLPTQIRGHFGEDYAGLALEYCIEDEPLGTGGGIAYAARGLRETFFALNGDRSARQTSTSSSRSTAARARRPRSC